MFSLKEEIFCLYAAYSVGLYFEFFDLFLIRVFPWTQYVN